MSNHNSPRLGARVEAQIRERRSYERPDEPRPWMDAVSETGRPVEIKAAQRERSDGSEGRFRIFREPHRRLAQSDGLYVFAVYRVRGTGAQILDTTAVSARSVRVSDWVHSGHRTDGREMQRRIPISEVF